MRSRPRREWWSLVCALKWPVSSLMRAVSKATWTSGDPVSPSVRWNCETISDLTIFATDILISSNDMRQHRGGAAVRCNDDKSPPAKSGEAHIITNRRHLQCADSILACGIVVGLAHPLAQA